MWYVEPNELLQFRTPGGDRFTEFVDAIIRAHARVLGLQDAEIATSLRTNIRDGGVDTRIDGAISDDPSGRLSKPTIWQYKATDNSNISDNDLKKEANKKYARQCILDNYSYRLCICDDLTPEKKSAWAKLLTDEIREINPAAEAAQVLTSSDLAAWASQFPALVSRYFRPTVAEVALHLRAWEASITSITRIYVPVPNWNVILARINTHLDFSVQPVNPVLPLQGEAGVGKTRAVYEALSQSESLKSLVVYLDDEKHARDIARTIANDESLRAVLVADECSVQARVDLADLLKGHMSRVRIIAIDNSGHRPASDDPEIWLEQMPPGVLNDVLARNFPSVPADRRETYASLAGGFVRLAADMCHYDPMIAPVGHVGPVMRSVNDYLHHRLTNDELQVIEAIAIVTRVGCKAEVEDELEQLCSLLRIDVNNLRQKVNDLHDGPGFVARRGRYLYITPEIIAQSAFDRAWRRWVTLDTDGFFARIPEALLKQFLDRVACSATEEVRGIVGAFFRRWGYRLKPRDLASLEAVDRLVTLIETEPKLYLALLRGLLEHASRDELLAIHGESMGGRWGPRRPIVWLAERFAAFAEHFDDAERILLRLAVAESEPALGNNATRIWQQLFRIYLSGTALPFRQRLELLEQRIQAPDEEVAKLGLRALDEVFDQHGTRVVGPAVVAGKITPPEWAPQSRAEEKECLDAAVALLMRLSGDDHHSLREAAHSLAIAHLRTLLDFGYLEQLKTVFDGQATPVNTRARVLEAGREFLHFDVRQDWPSSAGEREVAYITAIHSWLDELVPSDLHGKLVSVVGSEPWAAAVREDETAWQAEVQALASQLHANSADLDRELEWLCSDAARSAALLGEWLGRLDTHASTLDTIIGGALHYRSGALARGYIRGLVSTAPQHLPRISEMLDAVALEAPQIAYELALAGGNATGALERTLKLIDEEKLPATHVYPFAYDHDMLPKEAIIAVIERLIDSVRRDDPGAARVLIDFTFQRLAKPDAVARPALDDAELRELAWRAVEETADQRGNHAFWWARILQVLVAYDADRAASVTMKGLAGDNYSIGREAAKLLIAMTPEHAESVMTRFGEVLLDDNRWWHLYVGRHSELFRVIPASVAIDWVATHGGEAARRLARHLPPPFLNKAGEPEVPALTAFVLHEFEDDDHVIAEFFAGVHSLQLYSGDIAAQFDREAELARHFLDHESRRIRDWARAEIERSTEEASRQRQEEEERILG